MPVLLGIVLLAQAQTVGIAHAYVLVHCYYVYVIVARLSICYEVAHVYSTRTSINNVVPRERHTHLLACTIGLCLARGVVQVTWSRSRGPGHEAFRDTL